VIGFGVVSAATEQAVELFADREQAEVFFHCRGPRVERIRLD
jgi:hypothetical protein